MQTIYKIDLIFLWIYSAIIMIIGVVGAVSLGNILFFAGALLVEVIYLFLSFRRPYRRYRALKQSFPVPWKTFLAEHSLFYKSLDTTGKKRFEQDIQIFLSDFSIEGIQRRAVDLETKLLVAAGAAALLHGRPTWEPPFKDGVVIFPGDRFDRNFRPGKGYFAGMATRKGPLLLTETSLLESFKNPRDGHNVVYHEMAHYFDQAGATIPWRELVTEEWRKASEGRSFLGDYAGINEAELFAVAAEAFFEKPWEMKAQSPKLYDALKEFFNLDTVKILIREKIEVEKVRR
ncbi:MAG: MtfA peptidase [Acidobacteriota bacterium]|nr:MtfA peptidase [Acidobacteriota bacterium]